MRRPGFSVPLQTAAWLLALFGVALAVRIGITYDAVFGHDTIRFVENDAWYHMRLVDATLRHFPQRLWFDPYLVHPGGEPVDAGPFFDWVIAGVALLLGLGSPSSRLVDVVGAYVPAVMGALLCAPVYVLGRELCSRRAGRWAAFLVAVVPSQTLIRSQLGFTDHHCAETLLSTTALMWIVLALDPSRPFGRRLWLSGIGGVTLGCYLLTWSGGSLFVLVVVAAAGTSLIFQRLRGRPVENLPLLVTPALGVAAGVVVPWVGARPYFVYHVASLVLGLLVLCAVQAWGNATASYRHNRAVYLAGMAAGATMVLSLAYTARGGWSGFGLEMRRLLPWGRVAYVSEALPLLQSDARYPLPLWNEFGPCLFLAVVGGAWFLARPRVTSARGALLAVWTGVFIAATFAQVRFTYYLGVNVALLAGFACDALIRRVELYGRPSQDALDPTISTTAARRRGSAVAPWALGLVLALLVTMPLAGRIQSERHKESGLSDDWSDALQWLNANTPEPFNDRDAYYRTDFDIGPGANRPASAYGVLAWWDYGYFIIRVARRVPNTNPRQTQAKKVASFLLAESPTEASTVLDVLGSRYIIVDARLQARLVGRRNDQDGFFAAIALAAGRTPSDYCQQVELPDDGMASRARLYCFPKYYRTMAVRLYAFGGRAMTPSSVTAVSWTDHERGGRRVKRLAGERAFASYEEATRFIASRPAGHWRIASPDPLTSCVPLEALPEYRQVFRSLGQLPASGSRFGPALVQIYERSLRPEGQRQTQ